MNNIEPLTITELVQHHPEKVAQAFEGATSLSQVLIRLGKTIYNTPARQTLKIFAEKNSIPVPFYLPETHLKAMRPREEVNLATMLVEGSPVGRSTLIQYLLKYKVIPYSCKICKLGATWNDKRLSLQLDHENGVSDDNRIENLRFLCPNCHSQTDTYTGRNKGAYKNQLSSKCLRCSEISKNGDYCKACAPYVLVPSRALSETVANIEKLPDREVILKDIAEIGKRAVIRKYGISYYFLDKLIKEPDKPLRKVQKGILRPDLRKASYPPSDVLIARVIKEGYEVLSRELGVSGNAIRKHLRIATGSYPKTQAQLAVRARQ